MQETTHRQYLLWMEWLGQQWNKPSRTDHYIMAATRAILKSKKPLKKFKLPFEKENEPAALAHLSPAEAIQRATEWAQAKWFALTGFKPSSRNPDDERH